MQADTTDSFSPPLLRVNWRSLAGFLTLHNSAVRPSFRSFAACHFCEKALPRKPSATPTLSARRRDLLRTRPSQPPRRLRRRLHAAATCGYMRRLHATATCGGYSFCSATAAFFKRLSKGLLVCIVLLKDNPSPHKNIKDQIVAVGAHQKDRWAFLGSRQVDPEWRLRKREVREQFRVIMLIPDLCNNRPQGRPESSYLPSENRLPHRREARRSLHTDAASASPAIDRPAGGRAGGRPSIGTTLSVRNGGGGGHSTEAEVRRGTQEPGQIS